MNMYKNILLAVDLHPSYDDHTAQKAAEFAIMHQAELYIIYAFEGIHAYGAPQGYEIIAEVENKIEAQAKKNLEDFSSKFNIPVERQIIEKGFPKNVVLNVAKRINADLIIVGGHSLHGLSLLLGSTADGISHYAHCDVLVIREQKG